MEIFIKKDGCKSNQTVRQIQEVSMCSSFASIIVLLLSMFKAFPIATAKYGDTEFIRKNLYGDDCIWFLVFIVIAYRSCTYYFFNLFNILS